MGQIGAEDLVFIDESGANLALTRLYARSPQGKRAFGSVPKNWGEKITILGALSSRGMLASMYLPGSCDQQVFLKYLEEVLLPQLWKGATVVLDNLSVHKSPRVEELLASRGVQVIYLPPYSPDLNPIEKAWSKLKSYLRRGHAPTSLWAGPLPEVWSTSQAVTHSVGSAIAGIRFKLLAN